MSLLLRDVTVGLTGRRADVRVEAHRLVGIEPVGADPAGAEVIDGHGGTLLPGLVDAHAHMLQWASARQRISVADATSAAHAAELVASRATPHDGLVTASNFHAGLWPDRPHKTLLDRALPGRPVALFSNDLHALWLSSAALRLVGRDHQTGVFIEDECMALTAALPAPATETSDRWVLEATDAAAARGVTTIADYEYTDTVADWTRRLAIRPPSTRIRCVIARFLLDEAIARGYRTGDVAGLLTIGPLKVFLDGSLNTVTAYCFDGAPGELLLSLDELVSLLRKATTHGISPAVHAIGDHANRIALDAFAALGTGGRIEHAQLVAAGDLPR